MEKKYWDEEVETMPLDKLRKVQGERLQELVGYAYERTKFYRCKFDEAGVKPGDINTVDDLTKLPLIEDDDIRNAPLEDKLSVPWDDLYQCCSSAGTTGFPEPLAFTKHDFEVGCLDSVASAMDFRGETQRYSAASNGTPLHEPGNPAYGGEDHGGARGSSW